MWSLEYLHSCLQQHGLQHRAALWIDLRIFFKTCDLELPGGIAPQRIDLKISAKGGKHTCAPLFVVKFCTNRWVQKVLYHYEACIPILIWFYVEPVFPMFLAVFSSYGTHLKASCTGMGGAQRSCALRNAWFKGEKVKKSFEKLDPYELSILQWYLYYLDSNESMGNQILGY